MRNRLHRASWLDGVRSAWRDRSGMAAIEFAFVAPLFIALLVATVQIAVVYVAKTSLQDATEAAGRLVMTNQAASGAVTSDQFKTALCSKIVAMISCAGVMISLQQQGSLSAIDAASPKLTYDANGNVTNTFSYSPGPPGVIMVLHVFYLFPVVAAPLFGWGTEGNGSMLLVSTFVFQNEPA